MANQRDVARSLGMSQATVSLALRDDPAIPAATRERVQAAARRLGYRQNPYVAMLMAHIRSGRSIGGQTTIAVVVDLPSRAAWMATAGYQAFNRGLVSRASDFGLDVEYHFLRAPGMSAARVDRALARRGIRGLVLAPPYRGAAGLAFDWSRYACVACGHGAGADPIDRIANHHAENAVLALRRMAAAGYRRIGVSLHNEAAAGGRVKWLAGVLEWQHGQPGEARLPLFTSDPARPASHAPGFRHWLRTRRPDAVLTLTGDETRWLGGTGIAIPDHLGLAALVLQPGSDLAGIDERSEVVGTTAVEGLVFRFAQRDYGLPAHPRLTLIDGIWRDGASLRAPAP